MITKKPLKISVVIPVYNEAENVVALHQSLREVLKNLGISFEIIFIDDGSTDNTLVELKKLKSIKIIIFRKNFGQTAALDAGIKQTKGKIIVTMDGDGQNDPKDIPLLLAKINEGYDVVSGWRWQRKDPLTKKFASRGANFLRKFFANDGIHDSGCTLKVYRRECFDKVDLYGEMHRFIPAILKWRGFKISEVKVSHFPRKSGETKYNWKRIPKGFLDMFSVWFWRKYANRPLHLFGGVGLALIMTGSITLAILLGLRLFGLISLYGRIWPLISVFLILTGVQFFVFGILADISIKNNYKVTEQEPYQIKEIFEE
jgi:glycosyltransferase involved in cell wall biosynthesis